VQLQCAVAVCSCSVQLQCAVEILCVGVRGWGSMLCVCLCVLVVQGMKWGRGGVMWDELSGVRLQYNGGDDGCVLQKLEIAGV
jgi:hypothetical protein